jgi:hypothetical protein
MIRRIFCLFVLSLILCATQSAKAITTQCSVIENACLSAGFAASGSKGGKGKGVWLDCVNPIMQGTKSKTATIPLPTAVTQAEITACKTSSATFGSGRVGDK